MEIKGSAVRTIPEYIKTKFPDKFREWLSKLPAPSAAIFNASIKPSEWYVMQDAAIVPTEILGQVAFDGDVKKASRECGRYSAESSLKGIYKFFLMAAPSKMVVATGGRILATFYKPVQFKVAESNNDGAKLHITQVNDPSGIIENRIAGWIERALDIQGVKASRVEITKSLTTGDPVTEITIIWS
ncbi:MAG: hypothetical protein JW973_00770 [Bacteroidales bacterium]|nr:hypothetical protein [Bacteroidales bacterium]